MTEHEHEHHHHHDEDCGCGHEHEHYHHHDEECGCGHEHEHHHHHDEECGCGHGYEHHHHHDEECGCGHEHEHHHHHDEECGCGHEHEHHHHHDEDCGCGHDHDHHHGHHEEETLPGVIYTNVRLQDDAKVVSGRLLISGNYDNIKDKLKEGLEEFAAAVNEKGGVVGHIKASVEVTTVDMFSVTESAAMIKRAPEQDMRIILAAIVFFVEPEEAEALAKRALEKIL